MEWLAVEKDFSPYAIRKNDYHDFEYYLENEGDKEGEKPGLRLRLCWLHLDIDHQYFCQCREYSPLFQAEVFIKCWAYDGIRPSEKKRLCGSDDWSGS